MAASRNISRRGLLRGAGALGLGGMVASATGCGTALATGVAGTGPAKNTLSYWNLFGGGDGVRMVAMEQGYSKSHPSINLNSVTLAWGNPYYTKLSLATLGDQPPDIAISHLTRMTPLADAGLLEELHPADLAPYGLTQGNFTPAAWQKAQVNGTQYAIPLDTHPFVFYYNTDVCKKAGLLNPDGSLKSLDGPDTFTSALAAAQKVTGAYGAVVSINNDTATQWRFFSTLYYQLGGRVLSDNGTKIVLDDAKAEQVLSFIQNLTVKQKLMPSSIDYGGAQTAFATGKAAFYLEGDWEITTFETTKTPFSMTAFPNVYGGTTAGYAEQADSHSFVLPRDSARTPERRQLIFNFIRTMLDQSSTWAQGGHIPAWLPYQNSAAYSSLKPESNYRWVANHAVYDDAGWFSGSGSDFENITGFAIGAVSAGQQAPAVAVADMRTKLTRYANTPSPVLSPERYVMAIQTLPIESGAPARITAGSTRRREESRAGWGLAGPFMICYLLFVIGPTIYGIIMSFFNSSLEHAGLGSFAGASNYVSALTSSDFWAGMYHTVLFTVMTTPPLVVVALVLAMFTDRLRHGRWFFRLLFFAPYVVPSAAVALIWNWLYTPGLGLWQSWLSAFGITAPNWLGDPSWAMASVALMTVWWTLGFNFVLYLAGLQDIPRELYEAAAVDGASPWRQLRSITLPLLKRTTMLVLILQIIASLKVFDQVYLMTGGGPNYVTRVILEYVYDIGFTDFRTGYAAAASMLYMVVIVAVSVVWFVINRRQQATARKGA